MEQGDREPVRARIILGGAGAADFFRSFLPFLLRNVNHDRVLLSAGALAFQTLLSLVPLLAVILSVLNMFEVFAPLKPVMEEFLLRNFMPETGLLLREYFSEFIGRASAMSVVGGLFLLGVTLMLISTIDHTLNQIWGVGAPRKALEGFTLYWTVLTLGPVLIGTSLAASSYAWYAIVTGAPFPELKGRLLSLLPLLNSLVALTLLYLLVPNRKVRFLHALVGGVFTTALFELSKKGFGFYISNIAPYQDIYGALSVIPILFLWIFLFWVLLLTGAEVVYSLGAIRPASVEPERRDPMAGFPLVLAVLSTIRQSAAGGAPLSLNRTLRSFDGEDPAVLRKIIDILMNNRFIHLSASGELEITGELYRLTLYDLYAAFPGGFPDAGNVSAAAEAHSARLEPFREAVEGCLQSSLQAPLVSLMEEQ